MTKKPASFLDDLKALVTLDDDRIDLADAALLLAGHHRAVSDIGLYRLHLKDLAAALEEEAQQAESVHERADALAMVMAGRFGYLGEEEGYDDLDNASLTHVIETKRGLPVALGILYIQTARACGWKACGLSFPSHFLIRIEDEYGQRAILDPFHGGRILDAASLRGLLKVLAGDAAELEPAFYEPVGNREILLRLQNNIKLRLLRQGNLRRSLEIVEAMLAFAPDETILWRELGMMHLRLGNFPQAILALEDYVQRSAQTASRTKIMALLHELRGRSV